MLEDLATNLSTTLAVASMLFFVAVPIVVTVQCSEPARTSTMHARIWHSTRIPRSCERPATRSGRR